MRFGKTDFPGTCIIEDMPFQDYAAVDAINWTALKEMAKSPERFAYVAEHGSDDIERGPTGQAFHAATFQPDVFARSFSTYPAMYPTIEATADGWTAKSDGDGGYIVASGRGKSRVEVPAKLVMVGDAWMITSGEPVIGTVCSVREKPWNNNATFCKAYGEALAGRGVAVLAQDDYQAARAMSDRLRARQDVQAMLQDGKAEVSMFWTDAQTGLNCKGRADLIWAGDQIADAKMTAKSGDWERWAATVRAFGYAGQAAMYRDGLDAIRKHHKKPSHDVRMFRWLVAEADPPYTTFVYDIIDQPGAMSYDWIGYGRALWHGYLQQVRYCLDNNEWPSGNSEPDELAVPDWMKLEAKAAPAREDPAAKAEAVAAMEAEMDAWKGRTAPEGTFPND